MWRWKGPHWRPVGTRRGMGRLPIARCYNSYKCTDRRVSTLPCNLRSSSLCATTAPLHLPSHASSCNSPFPTDIPLLLLIPKIPSQLSSNPISNTYKYSADGKKIFIPALQGKGWGRGYPVEIADRYCLVNFVVVIQGIHFPVP